MKPFLSKSAETLRNQVNLAFRDRDKRSDGWIGDARHQLQKPPSDHCPCIKTGAVRAIDIDSDLGKEKNNASYLADQLRLLAKSKKDNRISYIIYNKKIASRILNWKWRVYRGLDSHTSHI
ncbi:hypothetical protein UFOVP981_27, partial [uncultured Caudovirales phage]